ncbi:hypothetical protein JRC04_05515 [Mycolicibacterium sp. S2-37]|uniref:hypothetical protein n=1 Tax=Mycolicibacterium sp. S2-37 TaxID=2810297 RepID=UPI001A93DF74|nr:hypothetical protein [Mycolicibacterium sp. S2-37]MBO0676914.1 hypothetical protein [Mycolicibacterium sp. S2-37]
MSKNSLIPGKTPEQVRRAEGAATRQAKRDERTPEQQLALLDSRPGDAVKERARLNGQING